MCGAERRSQAAGRGLTHRSHDGVARTTWLGSRCAARRRSRRRFARQRARRHASTASARGRCASSAGQADRCHRHLDASGKRLAPSLSSWCETLCRTFLLCLRASTGVCWDAGEHEQWGRLRHLGDLRQHEAIFTGSQDDGVGDLSLIPPPFVVDTRMSHPSSRAAADRRQLPSSPGSTSSFARDRPTRPVLADPARAPRPRARRMGAGGRRRGARSAGARRGGSGGADLAVGEGGSCIQTGYDAPEPTR